MLALLLLAAGAQAGGLSVRLVEASNAPGNSSGGLDDVLPVLKRSLPYSNYRLAGSTSLHLPAKDESRQIGEYTVTCNGSQDSLSIKVTRGGQTMLTTQVNLHGGTPLVLGGFPSQNGKHVLVFAAH
jgi:hypothetical protein